MNAIIGYAEAVRIFFSVSAWRVREIIRNRSFHCSPYGSWRYNMADYVAGMSYFYPSLRWLCSWGEREMRRVNNAS